MTKHTILFLAANPRASGLLSELEPQARRGALDQEASTIRKELKLSGYRDRFELVTRWAAEPHDLLRELRELKPAVVHFSGHGGQDGLFFQAPNGDARVVSPAAIAETFGAAGGSVKLVVLSACYGEAPAEALLAHVDCVVGMSGVLRDDMARAFATGFYGALSEQESVATAYRHGNAAISLEGLPDADRPQLKVRVGVDATQIVLAAVAPAVHVALPCPYPGMRAYAANDADHFHGRSAEIDELIGRLRAGEREIYVIGPSGSGKSSLVAAGVLPRLARGVAGLGPFVVRTMRPGEHPATQLSELIGASELKLAPEDAIAALLGGRASGSLVLILIDQLEELFTLADAGERAQFLSALSALRAVSRCVVVFTLRADFFGAFMESPLWTDRHGRISRIEVAPLRGKALSEAIVHPARDLGVSLEPELIGQLLADAGSEPGILPLLQETLVQLWDRRQGQALTLADYQALGSRERSGLAVALSRRADAVLRELTPAQETIARRILLRLISFGEGRSDTRRQQPRSKLRTAEDDAAGFDIVLRRLIDARLLIADDDNDEGGEARVDLAHEVMIAAWPTLAGWIQTHRAAEQRRRQLEAAALQWVAHGRGARGLLDPIELGEAEAWQRTESARALGLSADVTALTMASRAVHDRQRRRRRSLVWSAFSALTVFAVVVTTLSIIARQQVGKNQRLLAQSYQEAGRQLLLDGHAQESIPYLIAARQKGAKGESLQMLFWAASHSLPLVPPLKHQGFVRHAAFNLDGTRIVTASDDATARVWDALTGKPLTAPLEHRGPIQSASFSPDGKWIVTASAFTVRVWDAISGKVLFAREHHGLVMSAEFSPDGTRAVTSSADSTARIWDVVTGRPCIVLRHRGSVRSAVFGPDGTRVVTASDDGTAQVWDSVTGHPLVIPFEHQGEVWSAVFSPDGALVVTAGADNAARIWDVATGKLLTAPLVHQGPVLSAQFSPDGKRIITASSDNTARVWDVVTGKPLVIPLVHQDSVSGAGFSPDGKRIITVSNDNTARVWDSASGKLLSDLLQHQGWVLDAAFSPDGTRVITASDDSTARVWDAAAGEPLVTIFQHRKRVWATAFSLDGTRIVTASDDNTARIWNATTGLPLTIPLQHEGAVKSAVFSPDGTRVITASDDSTARIWDAATGLLIAVPLQHEKAVKFAAFSPDGIRVVTASDDNTARIWDAATGAPLTVPLVHLGSVLSAAFSPDGKRVVTASDDDTACIWDAVTGKRLAPPLVHQGPVMSVVFSPDGARIATASFDRTARIWDAVTGKVLSVPLEHQGRVMSAVFSSDGARVVTASKDNTARIWDVVTGRCIATLEHYQWVRSAVFSPDGARVVTGSDDNTARIWDVVTGKPLAIPFKHQGPVWRAVFSPDGSHVATASFDTTARVWETKLDKGTLAEWSALIERGPFVLNDSVHVRRATRARRAEP